MTLQSYLEYYKGVNVTFTPDRETWIQGQEVWLSYEVTCDPPRKNPFTASHFSFDLNLFCDGQLVSKEVFGPSSHFKPSGEVQSSFSGKYVLSIGFGQNESEDTFGFRHLLPGHYEGFFDFGYVSPVFEFDVLSVPDTIQSAWADFQWIQANRFKYSSRSSSAILDSTLLLAPRLISSPWRVEGLSSALSICGFNRDIWSASDSLSTQQLLIQLASIEDAPPGYVILSVLKTVLAKVEESDQPDALDKWCKKFGNQKLLVAAANYRKSLENRNQKH